jgi:hypothetical protein
VALSNHEWSRDLGTYSSTHIAIAPSPVCDVPPLTNPAATLLRTRWFPSVSLIDDDWTLHGEADWADLTVLFVAWYDEIGPAPVPDPQDTDARIVATGRLTPHYAPSAGAPASQNFVVWDTDAVVIESHAQRKPNAGTLVSPIARAAIQVIDPTGYFYLTHASVNWLYKCYGEALYGWS